MQKKASSFSKSLLARRVELVRLMRAKDDPAFIEAQLRMRRTDIAQPVSDEFAEALKAVSAADLAADEAWRFAPVGVLSHIERDAINHGVDFEEREQRDLERDPRVVHGSIEAWEEESRQRREHAASQPEEVQRRRREQDAVLSKHRARARTLWTGEEPFKPSGDDAINESEAARKWGGGLACGPG